MSRITRRRFVKTTAAASAAFPLFTIAGTKASGKVIGANDTIRIGVAGINGRGNSHIDGFARQSKVDVTYLIDPDSSLFDSRTKRVQARGGNTPKCVQDVRQALNDKNVDAISIATCNHWHSLMTIWACQAGKDVYVEKPLSHNVFEGRKCVEAAARYKRVVQHGTQQRSNGSRASQIATIQSGKYGKLLVSKGYCCKPRWSIGFKQIEKPPAHLDWDMWLGPAPMQPFHRNLHTYNWHWFWDTGNGDTGNQGVHEMDVARWGIKGATMPNRIWSLGGRFIPGGKDQGQTPNMQLSVYEYGDVLLVFETRGLVGGRLGSPGRNVSNEFYTSEGVIKNWKFTPYKGGKSEPIEGVQASVVPGAEFGSFIRCMRTRQKNNADVAEGHYSSALCHLANVSFRLGKPAKFDAKNKSLGDNKIAVDAFEFLKHNLRVVNFELDKETYQLGQVLNFDPKTEKFIGNDAANKLLTRPYRKGYVVPDKV